MASSQMGVDRSSQDQDEFDNPPRGPVGVHRGPRSLAIRAVPYLIVILIAVLCGLGVWAGVSGLFPWQDGQSTHSQIATRPLTNKKSSSRPTEEQKKAESTPTVSPSPQASQSQSAPAPVVNKNTQVTVLNGTRIGGYAATKRQILVNAGYGAVTAGNSTGTLPAANVVWYQSENDKATAQDVANQLGISQLEQSASITSPIQVVLIQ